MKIAALIPAYNAARTVAEVVQGIPRGLIDEVIIVDDGSQDDTLRVIQALPDVCAVHHSRNKGYGAAQMTLYRTALERNADVMVVLHSDKGHDPQEIPHILAPVLEGRTDVTVGSRTQGILQQMSPFLGSRHLAAVFRGPMPGYKFLAHLALTRLQNFCYGTDYHCFHSGFRACSAKALGQISFERLTAWYDYDTEFLLAAHQAALRVAEVPVSVHYDSQSGSSAPVLSYGLRVLQHALSYYINGRNLKA